MNYTASPLTVGIFLFFVGAVLGLSFWLGRKKQDSKAYFAAHGQVGWFVNGIAFAGDYLSAASFLGICGMIAFYGYDGFLYSIGFLAGWVVALFVIAEPIKRLGKFTFADALGAKFNNSRSITLSAAISTLVVSVFYLIPQMVGAGSLVTPLLGWPHWAGVLTVGAIVILIVTTAGMVSTTWVQFIKGSLLVVFCLLLVTAVLRRGITTKPAMATIQVPEKPTIALVQDKKNAISWAVDVDRDGKLDYWQYVGIACSLGGESTLFFEPMRRSGATSSTIQPVTAVTFTPDAFANRPLGPFRFIEAVSQSTVEREIAIDVDNNVIALARVGQYEKSLTPGGYFKGIRSPRLLDRLDFVSLMLALFCGTAALPHILIRYYTVKDAAAARKSTVTGIIAIGFFYVLTLYIGLGAMVSGNLDPADSNMAAPLLAATFGPVPFAVISAIAFTTVLGTVSGLIMAASGAVAQDLATTVMGRQMTDADKVRLAKVAAIVTGVIAVGLGILFKGLNVGFLVGWAFNVAASANLPALVMMLFWRGTTRQGMVASIYAGLGSSVLWLLLTKEAFVNVYGIAGATGVAPFSQPGIVTIPLAFAVLVIVSLATRRFDETPRGFAVIERL